MSFAPVYIAYRLCFRVAIFFHHWYAHGTRFFKNGFVRLLIQLDEVFALKITLRYFFHPLYKDYTIVGRILGVIFRSIRIALGLMIYCVVCVVFLACYLAWLLFPLVIISYVVVGIIR